MVRSIAIFFSGCGVVLLIGGLIMWLNTTWDMCGNDNLRPVVSPNGVLQAVLFRRNCGATTSYSTQVSILRNDEKLPHEMGNIYRANREPAVDVRWIDNTHLVIDEPDGTEVSFRVTQLGEIQISDH